MLIKSFAPSKTLRVLVVLAVIFALCGCGAENPAGDRFSASESGIISSGAQQSSDAPQSGGDSVTTRGGGESYIDRVVRETVEKFTYPGMSESEKAKAAFDYIIENTSLADPVGLELWRIRGDNDSAPSFTENRSLSVLLYGIGQCEDYAAALTMLLRGMGMEARYLPGLTYAANGSGLVDHAWTVAKIDGVWYHLDCQLEDNISRRDTIRYKYFMKGDATMLASHRWGQNLIDSGLLTPEQNAWLARDFLTEPCPQNHPEPPPYTFTSAPIPDEDALKAAIEAETREYEKIHGALEPLEPDIIPPVFKLEGYPWVVAGS